MASNDPFNEIPPQPNPNIPETARERLSPLDLTKELRQEIPEQPEPNVPGSALEKKAPQDYEIGLKSLKEREKEAGVKQKELGVADISAQLSMRETYASRIFKLSAWWLGFIGVVLLLAGAGKLKLADSVQIALITTTTVNVLGLFYIVARWLFPNKGASDLPNKQAEPAKAKKTQAKKARAKNDQLT